jgi:hypothetical protein
MKCVVCSDTVTHPVCAECVANEIKQWLHEEKPKLVQQVDRTLKVFSGLPSEASCILCNNGLNVCTHCFAKEVFSMIQARAPELEESFLRQFDYELTGYCLQ